jgi:DNA primase
MAGHIPQSFIEDLLARVDITEIIGGRISLRRAGANYIAKCPFHTENTPSFTVNPTKQFYHCFGCGVTGDALRFLTEHDGLHFVEAVETLASRVGLTVPTEKNEQQNAATRYAAIYAILAEASQFYREQLRKHPAAKKVHQYLKSRGLKGEIAKQFGLGYAPQAWDSLVNHLGTNEARLKDLMSAGLVIQKNNEDRYYDRFRERIIFPIHDRRGRVVGFGGRIIGKEGEPKYLNSPETPVFHKGGELYGLYEARTQYRSLNNLIVVEGYLDVVSLAQWGVKNSVAALGTALTEKHIKALFAQTSEVIFCFDGDKAGKEAARRTLPLILPHMKEGRRVKFVVLPEGEDPDSYVQKEGPVAFLDRIQRASSLSDFIFESFSAGLDLNHLDSRAQLVTLTKPLIGLLPNGVFQQMMYDRLAELTHVDSAVVQGKRARAPWVTRRKERIKPQVLPPSPAHRAAVILLKNRELLALIEGIDEFCRADTPGTSLLCAIIKVLQEEQNISAETLVERLTQDCIGQFTLKDLHGISDFVPEAGVQQEFLGALQRLRERAKEQAMESLLMKAKMDVLTLEEKAHLRNLLEQREKNRSD